ncbi:MAG: response regulator [Candidatus Saccharimonadales bacterium]
MPRVLLVEDEDVISEPIGIVLKMHSYQVDTARNGRQALQLCKKHSYDLILLDIMMPVCNGVEFLKLADLKHTSPKTKIIVMSNLALGGEIKEALELGARMNVLKANITPASLLELIESEVSGQSSDKQKS